ncbi:MAG TPA: pilin [Candidatus Saccharimonadales bacterium]
MIIRTLKNGLAALFLFVALAAPALPVMAPVAHAASSKRAACEGVGLTGGECNSPDAQNTIYGLVGDIVNILSIVVGIVAVIMIIVSGLKYVTASGDTSKVASAKSTLVYAVVGIVIAALAQFIVHFVLENI